MRKFLKLLLLVAFVVLTFPQSVLAAEVINEFKTQIVAHKDGSFDVTEEINYDFGASERHGIYRDIPLVSKVGNLSRVIGIDFKQILRDGSPESYSLSIASSKASVKIGRADSTISGPHTYTISYLVKNGMGSNFEDHDELYWNVTGNGWQVPIQAVSAEFSTDFGVTPNRAACFTGVVGSTLKDCDANQISVITTTRPLNASEGLTVVWGFPKGTFPPSVLQKSSAGMESSVDTKVIVAGFLAIVVLLNFVLAPILLFWYFKNKRKERFGSPAVNFDFPEDRLGKRVTPAEAGSIDVHQVDQNDIIATIFDLAIRKYIKIEQVKTEKVLGIFGKGEDYKFIKLKNLSEGTTAFEKVLLDEVFGKSDEVKLSSLQIDFYKTFQKVEKAIFDSLISRALYIKNPKTQMALLLAAGAFALLLGGIILGPVLIFLSRKLNGRTALGDEVDWKVDGLKIFLKNMTRHYTWQAKNLYTVEKYIPYAIAFGFIKEFMEQLKVVYPKYEPTWYSGNTAFYLASNDFYNSMSSSFTTRAPSSSSGFSGGSSGGGGGGGGGGSW